MVIWNLNTSFGFSWRHCCELVLFFFLFSKKKEESILSSAYHWVALIKAKINFVCLYIRIPILLKDEFILISTDLLQLVPILSITFPKSGSHHITSSSFLNQVIWRLAYWRVFIFIISTASSSKRSPVW